MRATSFRDWGRDWLYFWSLVIPLRILWIAVYIFVFAFLLVVKKKLLVGKVVWYGLFHWNSNLNAFACRYAVLDSNADQRVSGSYLSGNGFTFIRFEDAVLFVMRHGGEIVNTNPVAVWKMGA